MSEYVIYKGKDRGDQQWRWRLKDDNGEIIAHGGEAFRDKAGVMASIKKIKNEASDSPVFLDESPEDTDQGYRFEIRKSDAEQPWSWRFRSGNHQIMAVGENYASKSGIEKGVRNVQLEMGRADIVWEDPKEDPARDAKDADTTPVKADVPPGSWRAMH